MYFNYLYFNYFTTLVTTNQEPLVVKEKAGRSPVRLRNVVLFPRQCFDTNGWATGVAFGL